MKMNDCCEEEEEEAEGGRLLGGGGEEVEEVCRMCMTEVHFTNFMASCDLSGGQTHPSLRRR